MSKASKRRACPAVAREITAAECGENRGSRYACPADCPYSPLTTANYSQLLELEDAVDNKCRDALRGEARKSAPLDKAIQKVFNAHSAHAVHAFYEWQLFFRRDAEGMTLVEKWQRTADLKNDERVLLRAKMQTRVALLEVHRIIDHQQIEAVDLLSADPAPFLLQDRSLSSVATRFSTGLVWLYSLPHYTRLSGTAIILPQFSLFDATEIVMEIVRHLGGPITEAELRLWLAEHFVLFDEALNATAQRRRLQMFASMDAQFGKAVYELRAPFGECRDLLDEVAEIEPDRLTPQERDLGFAEARVWFAETRKDGTEARPALGRVLLGQSHFRLEAMGAERTARLRDQFEALMGERARFTGEVRDDLASRLAGKGPKVNESLVPPRLLEQPQQILLSSSRVPTSGKSPEEMKKDWMAKHDRAFLDNSVPALEGRTPREAAADPSLRPKLIRLMKQRVHGQDERNLETGESDDVNWMLRELGLDEIVFDPPPARPPLKKPGKDAAEDWEDDPLDDIDESLYPPPPPLPKEPQNATQVVARLDSLLTTFPAAIDAVNDLDDCGSTWLDDARYVVDNLVNDREFDLAVVSLVRARYALVPPGYADPLIDLNELADAFDLEMEKFIDAAKASIPRGITEFLQRSRQPALVQLIIMEYLKGMEKLPKKDQPSPKAEPALAILLKVMIDELDKALRKG